MVGGYAGRLLEVDLSGNSVSKVPLDLDFAKNYIGGRGFIAKLLWDRLEPGIDPLSPNNILMFLIGPITGIFGGGQTCVGFKSPETETIGHSIVGGHWGAELKFSGYDGIIVVGKANAPVYLYVKDDDVEIRDARHLWGRGTAETERMMKEELEDPFSQVVCCGPAGENMVRTTSLIHEGHRAAARGGGGAVMGSKKLKAVAVRGTNGVKMEDARECFRLIGDFLRRLMEAGPSGGKYVMQRYGTTTATLRMGDAGATSVKNQREGSWPEICKTGGIRLERRNIIWHASDHSCPVGCFQISVVRTGQYAGTVAQIDFDSSAVIGPNCLVTDIDGLQYLNALCDEFGVDAEGIGGIIAWAMECYEKGILTKEDLGGIDLRWGDVSAMVELIKRIVGREGIGDLLAEGLRYAPKRIGKGSERFAMHCKGMGFGGWHSWPEERGLQYAVGDRGGCHHYGASIDEQNWRAWADSLLCCSWHNPPIGDDYAKLFNAATGWDLIKTRADWDLIAERMLILARAYNIREGMRPLEDDVLPERAYTEPLTYGETRGKYYPREKFLENRAKWYRARGCDEKGIPTREHLKELDLDFVIPVFEKLQI